MHTLFWVSTLCLFFFVIGFCVYAGVDLLKRRSKTKAHAKTPSGGTPLEGPSEASLRDSVTFLYNKKHLLNRLHENIARCNRTSERMAVILWDIDGFVSFNNQFGQDEGDRLLKKVSEVIHRCVRMYDETFRSGPDEFCAILIPANEAIALEVTQRVSQTISRDLFEPGMEYAARRFSVSSGLVFYPGPDKLPESLLHAAGQELYRSKQAK